MSDEIRLRDVSRLQRNEKMLVVVVLVALTIAVDLGATFALEGDVVALVVAVLEATIGLLALRGIQDGLEDVRRREEVTGA